ncbi:MAG: N-terminal C2 in EEIG1 and EHBP1 proteins-domain-containing protein [Piptocephalis tieghemiana]|nr:MAG: N-terminal C2 in EEIG1 and EHBP1 proteins-domain-containing protein [Piptocephalis tieghemiana]
MSQVQRIFSSKARKLCFRTHISLHDLSNVPLLTGEYHVRWKIKAASVQQGRTHRSDLHNHIVNWDEVVTQNVTTLLGKDGILLPCEVHLSIYQVIHSGGRENEKIGTLTLNLSEYAGHEPKVRRYLLENSRFNCTLRLSIQMTLVEGGSVFGTPPLNTSQICKDLTGLIARPEPATMAPRCKESMSRSTFSVTATRAGREARAMEVVNAILADMNTHASSSSPTTPMSPEDFEDVSGNLDHEDRFDMQPSSMMERIAE